MTSPGRDADRIWKTCASDSSAVDALAGDLKCPRWFAALLVQRGAATAESAERLLHPRLRDLGDPFLLPDMGRAVDRLMKAIAAKECITVFGDYDVDGLTSAALLSGLLRKTGVPVQVFLPLRLEEGYGLSTDALTRCLEETSPTLIVTVDCGTGSVDAVKQAAAAGVDVIVTDHHAVGEHLAPASAVVNPRRSADESLHGLAGVGVAFKLAHALIKRARLDGICDPWAEFDLKEVLDLVALGTVADLVPLREENRILVHHGLKALNATKRPGVRALIEVAGIKKAIDTYEVGYQLGPRLNASGRLGTAQTSLQLLLTESPSEAEALARELDDANRERQQVERDIVEQLMERIDARLQEQGPVFGVVEADRNWHAGVVGIAAARVMQKYHRPSVVIGIDDQGRAKGSCRSISGLSIVEVLEQCSDLLIKFGGHAMAAGVELEWDLVDDFRRRFEQVASVLLHDKDLTPELSLDGWINTREVDETAVKLMESLKPFGIGHPEPVWGAGGLMWAGPPREVGKGHLKARLSSQGGIWDAIGFGLYGKTCPEGLLDAAFHIRRDSYQGRESLVLHLKDFRASQVLVPETKKQ